MWLFVRRQDVLMCFQRPVACLVHSEALANKVHAVRQAWWIGRH